jgi:hypothetical protein
LRLRTIPLLVIIIAAVAGLGAWTDKPNVRVREAPRVVKASKPWNAIIEVTRRGRPLDGYRTIVTMSGPRGTEKIRAKELGGGRYRVRMRMPHGGFYTYTLVVGDRIAARGTIYSIPK